MKITQRIVIPAGLAAALWFAAGCDGLQPFFDSTNADPHPPVITGIQSSPDRIFTGDIVTGTLTYLDEGGDIEELAMRDLDGGGSLLPVPPASEDEEADVGDVLFFPGTSGEVEWQVPITTSQAGVHRIKVWLVDSKESRSAPAFFEVTVDF